MSIVRADDPGDSGSNEIVDFTERASLLSQLIESQIKGITRYVRIRKSGEIICVMPSDDAEEKIDEAIADNECSIRGIEIKNEDEKEEDDTDYDAERDNIDNCLHFFRSQANQSMQSLLRAFTLYNVDGHKERPYIRYLDDFLENIDPAKPNEKERVVAAVGKFLFVEELPQVPLAAAECLEKAGFLPEEIESFKQSPIEKENTMNDARFAQIRGAERGTAATMTKALLQSYLDGIEGDSNRRWALFSYLRSLPMQPSGETIEILGELQQSTDDWGLYEEIATTLKRAARGKE